MTNSGQIPRGVDGPRLPAFANISSAWPVLSVLASKVVPSLLEDRCMLCLDSLIFTLSELKLGNCCHAK